MPEKKMKLRAILAYMQNRPGVLNKVSMLLRRKMYNVDTITICASRRPGISRMTLTLHEDDDDRVEQVVKQVAKIPEVIEATSLEADQAFLREVAMIKFDADAEHVVELSRHFSFEILHHENPPRYIVQVAGSHQEIDDFIAALGDEKILEMARSGYTAIEK